jgi:hypothetical protein
MTTDQTTTCSYCGNYIRTINATYIPRHTVFRRSWRTLWRTRAYMCQGSYTVKEKPNV